MSPRALQTWSEKAKTPPTRRPGRPCHSAAARAEALLEVEREWRRQGIASGEGSVYAALKDRVSRTLVRESLRELKAALRRRERARIEEQRWHLEVHARNALWSQDATELGRRGAEVAEVAPALSSATAGGADAAAGAVRIPAGICTEGDLADGLGACFPLGPEGEQGHPQVRPAPNDGAEPQDVPSRDGGAGIVQAEIVRDVASTKTLDLSIGPPASAAEVIAQLERLKEERGELPLILARDRGSVYRSKEVMAYLAANMVVALFSEPHTPEHNPWIEHGNRELKEEAGIGAGSPRLSTSEYAARMDRAALTLDHHRLRKTRGYRTAADYDLALPAASGVCSRAVFYEATCRAIACAMTPDLTARERRRAEREAIFSTAESFGLLTRTRGRIRPLSEKRALLT